MPPALFPVLSSHILATPNPETHLEKCRRKYKRAMVAVVVAALAVVLVAVVAGWWRRPRKSGEWGQ